MQEIGIADLRKITEIVKNKYNYDFSNYASSSFKRRITRILEIQRTTIDGLIETINSNKLTKEAFLHEITVNVTEMFRDPSFWKAIKNEIAEALKTRNKIRIWHAGCSSGEEVFSMLIVLQELGCLDKAEIIASDIDKNILAKAKEGKISHKNMELNTSNYTRYGGTKDFSKYFTADKDFSYFNKNLMSQVSFREIDLVTATPFTKCDIVLCRNVLIYFNQTLQNNVLKLICDNMFMGGLMAIGSKESISWCDVVSKFSTLNIEEKIFKKIKE